MAEKTPDELIDALEAVRAKNNREWCRLVRLAWEVAPERAREISRAINANDEEVIAIAKQLAAEPPRAEKRAVLLPGGGVLHTYAVREALALGLVPIVTDRDPNCPCAKIPGVEFHEIDCYDVEHHLGMLASCASSDVAGAFCGGADTHVVVAAVAEKLGSRWVSRKTAETCKDKLLAKQALQAHDVPTALLTGGTPCVLKPRKGSGSRGVRRRIAYTIPFEIERSDLQEELLEGPEQSVEILLGPRGRGINIVDRYFAWVDDQPLEWGHTNPSWLDDETKNELYKLAFSAAHAVGADVGFFKIDSILTKDGPKVLECTPRLSGGFDSQLSTPRSSGRNLLRYGLQIACGLPLDERLLEFTREESVTVIHRPELACAT